MDAALKNVMAASLLTAPWTKANWGRKATSATADSERSGLPGQTVRPAP